MPDETSARLELLSRELLERLTREDVRPEGAASTELVGGVVKAGAKLEGFLREVITLAASLEGRKPEEFLATVGTKGGTKPSLRKAMAGPMAWGIKNYFAGRNPGSVPKVLRPLIADLVSEESSVLTFITMRNQVAKEGGDPSDSRGPVQALGALLIAFRKNAGWAS